MVARPDRPELLGREVVQLPLRSEVRDLIASSTSCSTGSSFLRPMPKLMREKIESMIAPRSERMSSARRFVRAALFPHAMSYPTPDGLMWSGYATAPPIGWE